MAMSMGRILSSQGLLTRSSPISISISQRVVTQRHRSGKAHQAQLIEVEVDSSDGDTLISGGGIRKLEEVIQNIIARRAAPDWLPFLPGYSYWVPPTSPDASNPRNFIEVVGKLSAAAAAGGGSLAAPPPRLAKDETVSFRSTRGWPSYSYFIPGTSTTHPVPVEMEVEVKICDIPATEPSNTDEEG